MELTHAETAKFSNDPLLARIIEFLIKGGLVLQALSFIEIVGKDLKYKREKTATRSSYTTWETPGPKAHRHSYR